MIVLKTILVATDFSDTSDTALTYGRDLARSYESSLHVLHVVESAVGYLADAESIGVLMDLQAQIERHARGRLETVVTDEDRTTLHARPVILTAGRAADGIVQYAKDNAIDLIVIGTHGRSGFAHAIMGSVAERVIRLAPCPVLTVRHPEREFVAPDALVAVKRG
jgi:nucleotide-binding universal stress UspA family protein